MISLLEDRPEDVRGGELPGGGRVHRARPALLARSDRSGGVQAAYLLRLRAMHPDSGGDTAAAATVTAAYDALRSGVRRGELLAMATVDREGEPGAGPPGAAAQPAADPPACWPTRQGGGSWGRPGFRTRPGGPSYAGRSRRSGRRRGFRRTSRTWRHWIKSRTCWW